MYAVLGLATDPRGRLVELAIVHADRFGRVLDEWSSLVNPDHDPVAAHGIAADELRLAPPFRDLAGQVAALLRARAVVAHNLPVRAAALALEFERIGAGVPVGGLCTLRLAGHFLPTASRGLDGCRAAAGLPPHRVDAALPDARATLDLLAFYLAATGSPPPWLPIVDEAAGASWPALPILPTPAVPRRRAGERPRDLMALAVERLPRFTDPAADAYAETLDRALTASDSRGDLAGTGVAERLGLNPDAATALRRAYLTALAITLRDLGGGDEQLSAAADLLGVRVEETTFREGDGESPWQLRAGDTVVFAGTLYPSRDRWLREARAAGLVVGNAVTRRTRLMVTADPDSRTGNAEKARRYQVPIVHPAAYQEILRRTSARWVRRNSRLP